MNSTKQWTRTTLAGRYLVIGRLSPRGSVALARDCVLDRLVAVKHGDRGARTMREAVILASLDHRAVVRAIDVVDGGEGRALIMERITGVTLRELVAFAPLPAAAALRIALEIVAGLVHLHERGVLHLDLDLDNVMIAADGQPKLIDFGLARRFGDGLVDPAANGTTDLFMLGALLYELFTGMRLRERWSPHELPSVGGLSELISQLLARAPAARPSSAHEVLVRLAALTPQLIEPDLAARALAG